MDEYGKVIGEGTVRFERLLPGPIERVWAYLTESDKRGEWLARGEMELREGGLVELRFLHAELTPHDEQIPERYRAMENGATMRGAITRCEPPHALSFTWGEVSGAYSEVSLELFTETGGVRLVLVHHRLANAGEMVDVASGWHTHLEILRAQLDGVVPPPFWGTHLAVEAGYAARVQHALTSGPTLPGSSRQAPHA
jgi:uncharacterized protein YndB with AHSA1/START domain